MEFKLTTYYLLSDTPLRKYSWDNNSHRKMRLLFSQKAVKLHFFYSFKNLKHLV